MSFTSIVALPVVSDTPSNLVSEEKRQWNNLLFVLNNICTQVVAGSITAAEGWSVLGSALSAGKDSDITGVNGGADNYTGTGLELLALQALPKISREVHRNTKVVAPADV